MQGPVTPSSDKSDRQCQNHHDFLDLIEKFKTSNKYNSKAERKLFIHKKITAKERRRTTLIIKHFKLKKFQLF